ARAAGLEVACALVGQSGFVRRPKIRRTAEEPGDVLREHIQRLGRSVAPRNAFRIGGEDRQVAVPAGGKFAPLHLFDLGRELGVFGSISGEEFGPLLSGFRTSWPNPGGK